MIFEHEITDSGILQRLSLKEKFVSLFPLIGLAKKMHNVMYTARRAKYSGCCVLICSQNSPESALQSGLQADALDRKTGINFS
jgi:hypothetical protein